jgi:NADH-quinone oxidoreductase subunit N
MSAILAPYLPLAPEILLALAALLIMTLGVFGDDDDGKGEAMSWLAILALAGAAALILFFPVPSQALFDRSFIVDGFGRFMKLLVIAGSAFAIVMSIDYLRAARAMRFEFPVLVLLATVGMMMMISAGDLIALYIGLELQSLALYVLAAIRRDDVRSSEAGMKYFVLGALSSGMLLYGASLLYGFTGATSFQAIAAAAKAATGPASTGLLVGLAFLLVGLAFKVSAVPFHMWTPDVYEGSPTPVTAFFATAPKVAAMGLIARLVQDAFGGIPGQWGQVLAGLAVASMFLGAVAAIGQRDIKRLMAYSSIAHMGYALIGVCVGTAYGVQATLIYMAIYVTMNVGTFAFILSMERDGRPVSDIAGLNQFAKKEPLKALAMLVLLFSLAGVPPMVGFFGKFYVLKAAVDAGWTWLAVAGAVASVIGAFYYLRIVYFMYFGAEQEPVDSRMAPVQWAMLVVVAAIMVLGIVNLFGIEPAAAVAAEALVR